MSRSCRKTPIIGFAHSDSEKADKERAHRRTRRSVKSAISITARQDAEVVPTEPDHPRSGQWNFAKDGKRWVGGRDPKRVRK
jgi:hypothetical protein